MKTLLLNCFSPRNRPYLIFILAAIVVFIFTIRAEADNDGAFVLWGWSVLIAIMIARKHPASSGGKSEYPAWILLTATVAAACFAPDIGNLWAYFFLLSSLIAYTGGTTIIGQMILPCFILTILVPSHTYLYNLLSFPLSRLCTALTVGILKISGVAVTFENTVIYLGKESIAVTSACSGIELLEAMLLIGWIIVYRNKTSFGMKIAHFIMILPVIILCNSLRLVIVILLYRQIGTQAFEDPLHTIMGIGVVVATVLLMQLASPLFKQEVRHESL